MELLFFLIMAVALGYGVVTTSRKAARAADSREWPSVEGTIVGSEAVKYQRSSRGAVVFVQHITNSYHVRGHELHGDVLTVGRDGLYTSSPKRAAGP